MPFPIFSAVVAPPPKLMVVAVVLRRSKEAEPVTKLVVIVGDVPKTATPVPVGSDRELKSMELALATAVNWLEAFVLTNRFAVRAVVIVPERVGDVMVGDEDITTLPVPVIALGTRLPLASVKTAWDADIPVDERTLT